LEAPSQPRPLQTVRDRSLSLFQSAVAAYARGAVAEGRMRAPQPEAVETDAFTATFSTPFVEAADAFALSAHQGEAVNPRLLRVAEPEDAELARLAYALGNAIASGRADDARALREEIRRFSSKDYAGWITCAEVYAASLAKYRTPLYRDWKVEGHGSLDYGVIQYRLPNHARVGIIGDWGTGMDDARALLEQLRDLKDPGTGRVGIDALIHLGDIYYSGTPEECDRFLAMVRSVFEGREIPVFNLPGNHDYYAFGHGFYPMLDQLNAGRPAWRQQASYFCLRTEDGAWQFLGMDTGYNDRNPAVQYAPWLTDSEIAWHRHKLDTFKGKTILLSHHQLFSASSDIRWNTPRNYLNDHLLNVFEDYFDRVAAWFWGHEHNLVLYRNGLLGLASGRLVGASAYEETTGEDPYAVKHPQIPYLDPTRFRLSASEGYYNHSFAVIDLGQRKRPNDPVVASYYQYPSWGGVRFPRPAPPANFFMHAEMLDVPAPRPVGPAVQGNDVVYMRNLGGTWMSSMVEEYDVVSARREYFPRTLAGDRVGIRLVGAAGDLRDGAGIRLHTTEPAVGKYADLGAWKSKALYYYTGGYDQQKWVIRKRDASDPVIRYGDEVRFWNPYWKQWMASLDGTYLTTRENESLYWVLSG
jgi:3',5'-cyclic AMP phosphodiesterase CpdA